MTNCDYCGTGILFGGKREGNLRFCNTRCQQGGVFLALSRQVSDTQVQEMLWKVHQGTCPKCGGSGPVDVHTSYRVWSALVLTNWSNSLQVSCRSCKTVGRFRVFPGAGLVGISLGADYDPDSSRP